ncbi:hypothetical protein VTN02DRAFT_5296 [Thermoascus thermophilus]
MRSPTTTFIEPARTIRARDDGDDVFAQIASSLPGNPSSGLSPGAVGSEPESTAGQNAAGASGSDGGGIDISTRDSIIIGVVVGGAAIIGIILGILFVVRKKRRWDRLKQREEQRMRERHRITPPNAYIDPEAPLLPPRGSQRNGGGSNKERASLNNNPSPPPPPYLALPLYNPAAYHRSDHRPVSIESSRGYPIGGSWHRSNQSRTSHSYPYQQPIQLSTDLSPPAPHSQSGNVSDRQTGSPQSDPTSNSVGGDSNNPSAPLTKPEILPPRRPRPVLPKLITRL